MAGDRLLYHLWSLYTYIEIYHAFMFIFSYGVYAYMWAQALSA